MIRPTFQRSLILLMLSHLILDFFTGIWPIYKTIAQIDLAQAGLIAGASGFLGEVLQIFFGYFADRGFRKKMMIAGLALSSSVLWITFSHDTIHLFCFLLLLMLGSGAFHPSAVGCAGLLSSERKGRNILFFASGGAIGLGISQLAFTKVLTLCGGDAVILFIPVLVLIALLAWYPFPEQTQKHNLSFKAFFQPLMRAKRPLLFLYFAQVFNYTLMLAFIFLLPDLMRAKECNSWLCMGGGHFCFVIGAALLMIPAGLLCDRFGHKPVLLCVFAASLVFFYTFLMQTEWTFSKTIFFLFCVGGCLGTVTPILVSWANKLVPESPSTVSGLLMGFAWCLSNFGATWAGLLAKSFAINPIIYALCFLGLFLLLGFFLILFMPKFATSSYTDIRSIT